MTPNHDWKQETNTQLEMDAALDKSRAVQEWVRSTPAEEVSMQWRSQLNERLMASAIPAKKPKTWWFRPAFAGALASMVLIAGFWASPMVGSQASKGEVAANGSLEERLITTHLGMEFAASTATTGVSSPIGAETETPPIEWGPEDLDAL